MKKEEITSIQVSKKDSKQLGILKRRMSKQRKLPVSKGFVVNVLLKAFRKKK